MELLDISKISFFPYIEHIISLIPILLTSIAKTLDINGLD